MSFPRKREFRGNRRTRGQVWVPAYAGMTLRDPRARRALLFVAIDSFAPLVPLLRLDRQRGDRTGVEAPQRDRLAGLAAIAVAAVLDSRQRGLDLADHLALPVAGPQFDRTIG